MVKIGQTYFERYEIQKKLGEGAYGIVWLAEDHVLHRRVAIKELTNRQHRQKLIEEASAAAQTEHPNIVQVYDVMADAAGEPPCYIAMEFLPGGTLRQRLHQHGKLDPEEAFKIVLGVCRGLQAAHSKDPPIIHGDIKPDNILFDHRGMVKITDFGAYLPRNLGGQSYRPAGTPLYQPLQLLLGAAEITVQADLYAVIVMLYEMLCGSFVTEDKRFLSSMFYLRAETSIQTRPELIHLFISESPLVLPRDRDPALSAGLDPIFIKGLAHEPADCYQTVEELISTVRKGLENCRKPPSGGPTPSTSDTLELTFQLTARDDRLEVRATSPTGEAKAESTLPSQDLLNRLVTPITPNATKIPSAALKAAGRVLYRCLMVGDVAKLATDTLQNGARLKQPAQFELRFDADQILLAQYPWELIADDHNQFLVRTGQVDVTRYITYPQRPPSFRAAFHDRPLLRVVSQPPNFPPLPTIDLGIKRVETVQHATFEQFESKLLKEKIGSWGVQFDGHGALMLKCFECDGVNALDTGDCCLCGAPVFGAKRIGALAFKGNGDADWIPAQQFGAVLYNAKVQLALLLAGETVQAKNGPLFNGLAPSLLLAGVPAVVGMQYALSPDFASNFFNTFYTTLLQQNDLLAALRKARMETEGAWYSPVLYLRHLKVVKPHESIKSLYHTRNIDTAVPLEVQAGVDFLVRLWIRRPETIPLTQKQLSKKLDVPEAIAISRDGTEADVKFEPIEGKEFRRGEVEVELSSTDCDIVPENKKLFVDEERDAPPAIFTVRAKKVGRASLIFTVWQDGGQIAAVTHHIQVIDSNDRPQVIIGMGSHSVPVQDIMAQVLHIVAEIAREPVAESIDKVSQSNEYHVARKIIAEAFHILAKGLQEPVTESSGYYKTTQSEYRVLMQNVVIEAIHTVAKRLRERAILARSQPNELTTTQTTLAASSVDANSYGVEIARVSDNAWEQMARLLIKESGQLTELRWTIQARNTLLTVGTDWRRQADQLYVTLEDAREQLAQLLVKQLEKLIDLGQIETARQITGEWYAKLDEHPLLQELYRYLKHGHKVVRCLRKTTLEYSVNLFETHTYSLPRSMKHADDIIVKLKVEGDLVRIFAPLPYLAEPLSVDIQSNLLQVSWGMPLHKMYRRSDGGYGLMVEVLADSLTPALLEQLVQSLAARADLPLASIQSLGDLRQIIDKYAPDFSQRAGEPPAERDFERWQGQLLAQCHQMDLECTPVGNFVYWLRHRTAFREPIQLHFQAPVVRFQARSGNQYLLGHNLYERMMRWNGSTKLCKLVLAPDKAVTLRCELLDLNDEETLARILVMLFEALAQCKSLLAQYKIQERQPQQRYTIVL